MVSAAAVLVLGAVGASPAAAAAPRLQVTSEAEPTNLIPGDAHGEDQYFITVTNVGDAATDPADPLVITDTLPAGVTATSVVFFNLKSSIAGICTTAPLRCTYPGSSGEPPLQPGEQIFIIATVLLHPSVHEHAVLTNQVAVSGGGAAEASAVSIDPVLKSPASFGLHNLELSDLTEDGSPSTQAGAHPYELTTTISLNTEFFEAQLANYGLINEYTVASGDAHSILTELPPGFIGNPQAVPLCSLAAFAILSCPLDTQIGTGYVKVGVLRLPMSAYNLPSQDGQVAAIGLEIYAAPRVILTPSVRSGGDYGLRVSVLGLPSDLGVKYIKLTIWGVPAAPSHDYWRGDYCELEGHCGFPSDAQPPKPYLTNPTSCPGTPLTPSVLVDTWDNPGTFLGATDSWPAVDGCNQVPFDPTIEARPTSNLADSPSGLDVDLHLPLKGFREPEAISESNLRDTTVTLPPGLLVNPASASGLGACSEAQVGYKPATTAPLEFSEDPAQCPDAAKLGTVAVDTPVLDHPLPGAVYLAKQGENPFNSLLALYIAIDDPETGVVVKLAGQVTPDPLTGQLSATFEENPQLPFEDFHLHFFKGAQGALRTPATCGTYTTTSSLTPWSAPESGPPATPSDQFAISSAPDGSSACPGSAPQQPNAPTFHAGTESPTAAIYSPFGLRLVREDGSQELAKIDTILPPGLTGKLAGVAECSDAQLAAASDPHHSGAAEQATPSCPLSSEVGTVDVAAGAGPTPLNVSGKAYLAGPYKGAPLSLAIITPAVAGPFDLGTVVVRTALNVDPETAQIHAVSDEIPHILQGIPLDVRSIALKMNRPNFTLNPTNCSELAFTGSALSVFGQSAPLTQRFQVGGCSALAFKPGLKISLKGGTKRNQNPALTATVTYPKGGSYANIAAAQVTLPHSAFLDQAHIGTVCTRVQFAAHACPAASVYGKAIAYTPLLDQPLSGPVYLRSSSNKLPDLVADLNGQIEVTLDGKVDTGKGGGIRNTFEMVPDAPVSKFVLSMQGGNKGLLVNSENICSKPQKALAHFVGQNGKVDNFNPTIANSCKKSGKGGKGKGHRHHKSHRLGTSHR